MKRNVLYAFLCLFLGAALADWLSAPDANAQALPPSNGGSSYTLPSAISLPNGIDSQDGGTFVSRVKVAPAASSPNSVGALAANPAFWVEGSPAHPWPFMVQGKAGVSHASIAYASSEGASYVGFWEYSATVTGCWGASRTGGFGSSLIICPYLGGGSTMARITGHPSSSSYGVTFESYNGSALEVAADTVGGWWRVPKSGAGAPTGTDCDNAAEFGRKYQDTTNFRDYTCYGTAGWKYAQLL